MQFRYFNLQGSQDISDGEIVQFDELVAQRRESNAQLFRQHEETLEHVSPGEVNPQMERDPESWMKRFSTAIYLISGCVPDKADKRHFKMVYSAIKELANKDPELEWLIESPQVMFAAVPYLVTGFQVQKRGWSKDGNNNKENVQATISALAKGATVSTFLCAHREKHPEMVDELDFEAIRKACNLVLGIRENIDRLSDDGQCSLRIFQPNASVEGLSAVFPEIFLRYLHQGKLGLLLQKLDGHFKSFDRYLKAQYGGSVCLEELGTHKRTLEAEADRRFGKQWSTLENIDEHALASEECFLNDIVQNTAEKVRRFMPYYVQGLNITPDIVKKNQEEAKAVGLPGKDVGAIIESAAERFASIRTVVGKAIYETLFYSVWGQRVRREQEVIMGLEREHNLFQTMGIAHGYHEDELSFRNYHKVPSLYARRNRPEALRSLNDMTFRQFWRLSESSDQ